jgi:hypothetical protein
MEHPKDILGDANTPDVVQRFDSERKSKPFGSKIKEWTRRNPQSDAWLNILTGSVRASKTWGTFLAFLSIASGRITFPLLAAVLRASLGGVDFSKFLTGRTGTFKTALATICQQHFGAAMNATNLPVNFASTPMPWRSCASVPRTP